MPGIVPGRSQELSGGQDTPSLCSPQILNLTDQEIGICHEVC